MIDIIEQLRNEDEGVTSDMCQTTANEIESLREQILEFKAFHINQTPAAIVGTLAKHTMSYELNGKRVNNVEIPEQKVIHPLRDLPIGTLLYSAT